MRITYLAAMMLINCPTLLAQDSIVYRWVDEDNIVHYSHDHPTDKDYAEIRVQVAYGTSKNALPIETETDKAFVDEKAIALAKLNAEAIKQNCETAKVNLNVLQTFEQVSIKLDDDSVQQLSDKEKKEQIELSKKQVKIYCDNVST